jgi:hypothetical protein
MVQYNERIKSARKKIIQENFLVVKGNFEPDFHQTEDSLHEVLEEFNPLSEKVNSTQRLVDSVIGISNIKSNLKLQKRHTWLMALEVIVALLLLIVTVLQVINHV